MKRALTTMVLVAALVAAASATAGAVRNVKASAKFTVRLADQSGAYEFGQSRIVQSQLDWTPQVPVSLHAAPRNEPFKEFTLSGRVEKGTQKRARPWWSGSASTSGTSRCCWSRTTADAR
jgi:hypothetical protein